MTKPNNESPSPGREPSSSDRNGLSYDQRAAAATEAVRQLTSYFQKREK